MRVLYGFDQLPKFITPAVTIGSFDGVHRGHSFLLDRLKRVAKSSGGESIVLTFEPHPRIVLNGDEDFKLLTTLKERAYILEQMGIDNLIVVPFDREFSQISPSTFIREYLIDRVGIHSFIVGFDNHFGRDREGLHSFLDGGNFGFDVIPIQRHSIDSRSLCSTTIRSLVEQGEMREVAVMLSHPYIVCGESVDGRVTIDSRYKLLPPVGIYPVRVNGVDGEVEVLSLNMLMIKNLALNGAVIIEF